jgi:hypothetical protein
MEAQNQILWSQTMKTLIATSLMGLGLSLGLFTADAHSATNVWTTINETAPHSVFDDLQMSAPRTMFDILNETAPHSAFDALNDSAPRSLVSE